jgi:hypothetical protein
MGSEPPRTPHTLIRGLVRADIGICYWQQRETKRIESRCPDSSGNPYLAVTATVMAGLRVRCHGLLLVEQRQPDEHRAHRRLLTDWSGLGGVKNKIEPPAPSVGSDAGTA